MKKLRLLLRDECNRDCDGCCNKDWDIASLPVCHGDYSVFDVVMLTGGEPMLYPWVVHQTIRDIRRTSRALIYIYTAKVDNFYASLGVLLAADGMTVTLHTQDDASVFRPFAIRAAGYDRPLRVNIFDNVRCVSIPTKWQVKRGMRWVKNCPLPDGEVFMRLQ